MLYKTKKQLFTAVCLCVALASCGVDEPETLAPDARHGQKSLTENGVDTVRCNQLMDTYAKMLSVAVGKSEELRFRIREEAMLQFDGDYDILANHLHRQTLPGENSSVSALIGRYYSDDMSKTVGIQQFPEFFDTLFSYVPNLQVSVPVECEEWNVQQFIPRTVVLPLDFDESAESIGTYANGQESEPVSLRQDPTMPFIVVSESERIDRNGQSRIKIHSAKDGEDSTAKRIPAPEGLVVDYAGRNMLRLYWKDDPQATAYEVYRAEQNATISLIATVPASWNIYEDQNLVPGKKYTYMVKAIDENGNSSVLSQSTSWYAAERYVGSATYLSGVRFDGYNALMKYESWTRGKPELVLHVYSGTGENNTKEIKLISWITPQPERKKVAGHWVDFDIKIGEWDPDILGNIWYFSWSEFDPVSIEEISFNTNATWRDTVGRWTIGAGATVKLKITKNSNMGNSCIFFWDPQDEQYSLGTGFNFRVKTK